MHPGPGEAPEQERVSPSDLPWCWHIKIERDLRAPEIVWVKGNADHQALPAGTSRHVSPVSQDQTTLCTCELEWLLHLLHCVISRSRVASANRLSPMSPPKPGLIHGRSTRYMQERPPPAGACGRGWWIRCVIHPVACHDRPPLSRQEHFAHLEASEPSSALPSNRNRTSLITLASIPATWSGGLGNSNPATRHHVVHHRRPAGWVRPCHCVCPNWANAAADSQTNFISPAGARGGLLSNSGDMVLRPPERVPPLDDGAHPSSIDYIGARLCCAFHLCVPSPARDPCHMAGQERMGQRDCSCPRRGSRHHPGSSGLPCVRPILGKSTLLIG